MEGSMKFKMAVAFGLAVLGATVDKFFRTPVTEIKEPEPSVPVWYWAFVITTLGFFLCMVFL